MGKKKLYEAPSVDEYGSLEDVTEVQGVSVPGGKGKGPGQGQGQGKGP